MNSAQGNYTCVESNRMCVMLILLMHVIMPIIIYSPRGFYKLVLCVSLCEPVCTMCVLW